MTSEELLLQLLRRHRSDPDAAAERLRAWVEKNRPPFDPVGGLRQLVYPPQPRLPDGLPPFTYYFVPGSGQGSERTIPSDPTCLSFLKDADGIGLNLGCPLRLVRAIDALALIPEEEAALSLASLCDPRNHLAAVEETLWMTGWRSGKIRRGGRLPGQSGDVDWRIEVESVVVLLEAKFRRSDWARLVDYDTFLKAGDGFLSKALHKFPIEAAAGELHVVGVTTFDAVSETLLDSISAELLAAPQVHGIVIRSLLQMTHILARDETVAEKVKSLLLVPDARDLPDHYPVLFHIEQRDQRRVLRPPLVPGKGKPAAHRWIDPVNGRTIDLPEPAMYRMSLASRAANGEPTFTMIPKYLFV
ncbi:MAG: hypothetical protein Q8J74_01580 [Candidatus Didemnitutus sp.]|nr:hypothetical protein [Candidatus Didemnitutus sp.]